jgi:hypothetical protein
MADHDDGVLSGDLLWTMVTVAYVEIRVYVLSSKRRHETNLM